MRYKHLTAKHVACRHGARPVADAWVTTYVGKPSAVGLPTKPTQPTAHPSTAGVPTSYYSMWHYNWLCSLKFKSLAWTDPYKHVKFGI